MLYPFKVIIGPYYYVVSAESQFSALEQAREALEKREASISGLWVVKIKRINGDLINASTP